MLRSIDMSLELDSLNMRKASSPSTLHWLDSILVLCHMLIDGKYVGQNKEHGSHGVPHS